MLLRRSKSYYPLVIPYTPTCLEPWIIFCHYFYDGLDDLLSTSKLSSAYVSSCLVYNRRQRGSQAGNVGTVTMHVPPSKLFIQDGMSKYMFNSLETVQ